MSGHVRNRQLMRACDMLRKAGLLVTVITPSNPVTRTTGGMMDVYVDQLPLLKQIYGDKLVVIR